MILTLSLSAFFLLITTIVFLVLYLKTKNVLDTRIYEMKVARDESINILDEIREDLRSGRLLLKIDRIDGSNLYLRR